MSPVCSADTVQDAPRSLSAQPEGTPRGAGLKGESWSRRGLGLRGSPGRDPEPQGAGPGGSGEMLEPGLPELSGRSGEMCQYSTHVDKKVTAALP